MVGALTARRRLLGLVSTLVGLGCAAGPRATSPEEVWAFAAPWDPRSDSSLLRHGDALDVAVTGWIQLDSLDGAPTLLYPDTLPHASRRRFALVTSWHRDRFHPRTVAELGSDRVRLARVASEVAAIVARGRYRGVVLDLEGHRPEELPALRAVVSALADSCRRHGADIIALAIPATDTLAYPARAFVGDVDVLVPMLYDLNWAGSPPGPVVANDWARRWLEKRVSEVGADRIVAGLPTYGYYWRQPAQGETIGLAEARSITAGIGGELARDSASGQLHLGARGGGQVWVTDADQLSALHDIARKAGVNRIAIWRLGLEDTTMWRRLR